MPGTGNKGKEGFITFPQEEINKLRKSYRNFLEMIFRVKEEVAKQTLGTESQQFPDWIGGNNDAQKKATMEAYDSLSESHKAKKAITHWSTMSFDKQKKVKFRYNNNLWSCNIGNTGWTLIDSQQYVKDHLPNDILDINEDLNKRREAFLIKNIGIIQHMTSEGLAVHFTEDAAIRYVAESTDIGLADFKDEDFEIFRRDFHSLLGIDLTSWSSPVGYLNTKYVGEGVGLWWKRGRFGVRSFDSSIVGGNRQYGLSLLLQDTSVS